MYAFARLPCPHASFSSPFSHRTAPCPPTRHRTHRTGTRTHTTSLMHQHIAYNDHKFMTRHDQPSTAYSSNLFNSFTYLFSLGLRSSFLVLRMPQSPDCASAVSLLHLISTCPSVPPTRQHHPFTFHSRSPTYVVSAVSVVNPAVTSCLHVLVRSGTNQHEALGILSPPLFH